MFHITFYINTSDHFCTGRNYSAPNPEKALSLWKKDFPEATFISLKIN